MMKPLLIVTAMATVALVAGQEVFPFPETITETSFTCLERPNGYYADMETNCQVFHICLDNYKRSFLCENDTIFSQEHLFCDFEINVDCSKSESFYNVNDRHVWGE